MAEVIEIRIRQTGARVVARDIRGIGTASDQTGRSVVRLQRILATAVSGVVVRQTVQAADAFQLLNNRVRVFTDSAEEAGARVTDLVDIAVRTRAPLDGLATVFQRFSLVTQDAGIASETTVGLVENLAKAVAVSGATAQEAEGALRQLSQGFAANRLSGQEFNAVAEQIPIVAKLIAEELGVGVGQLRALVKEFSESGDTLITSEVILSALTGELSNLNRQFELIVPTVNQGAESLRTGIIATAGAFSQATGAGEDFARFLQDTGSRLVAFSRDGDRVAEVIEGIARAATVLAGLALPSLLGSIASAAASAATRLNLLAVSNPFGVIVTALSAAIALAIAFRDELITIGDQQTTLADLAAVIGQDIAGAFENTISNAEAFLAFLFEIDDELVQLPQSANDFFNDMVRGFNIIARVGFESARTFTTSFLEGINGIGTAILRIPQALALAGRGEFEAAGQLLGGAITEGFGGAFEGFGTRVQTIINDELATDFVGIVASSGTVERAAQRTAQRALESATTPAAVAAPEAATAARGPRGPNIVEQQITKDALAAFRELQAELDPQVALLQEYQERLVILGTALDSDAISLEEFDTELQNVNESFVEGLQALQGFEDLTGLDAFRAGFSESLKQLVEDAGSQTEILKEGFLGVFGEIGNAVKGVFTDAEFDVREFAGNIVGEISKVVSELIVLQLTQAALGGGGIGGPGGSVGGFFTQLLGFANGGTMRAGQTGIVGENGPELFTPPRTGEVVPNDQLGQALNPNVNVQVVNVADPADAVAAMSSREGEAVILNTFQRNAGKLRQITG